MTALSYPAPPITWSPVRGDNQTARNLPIAKHSADPLLFSVLQRIHFPPCRYACRTFAKPMARIKQSTSAGVSSAHKRFAGTIWPTDERRARLRLYGCPDAHKPVQRLFGFIREGQSTQLCPASRWQNQWVYQVQLAQKQAGPVCVSTGSGTRTSHCRNFRHVYCTYQHAVVGGTFILNIGPCGGFRRRRWACAWS